MINKVFIIAVMLTLLNCNKNPCYWHGHESSDFVLCTAYRTHLDKTETETVKYITKLMWCENNRQENHLDLILDIRYLHTPEDIEKATIEITHY